MLLNEINKEKKYRGGVDLWQSQQEEHQRQQREREELTLN
jgi:hypothetical protein